MFNSNDKELFNYATDPSNDTVVCRLNTVLHYANFEVSRLTTVLRDEN